MEAIAQTDYRCGVGVVLQPCDGAVWGPGSWAGVLWSPANGIITRLVSPGHCATLPGGREHSGNSATPNKFSVAKIGINHGPPSSRNETGCFWMSGTHGVCKLEENDVQCPSTGYGDFQTNRFHTGYGELARDVVSWKHHHLSPLILCRSCPI